MKSERSLSSEEAHEVEQYARSGRQMLGIDAQATPADVVAAVDGYVDGWPRRDAAQVRAELAQSEDVIHLSWAVGALWGNAIVQQFGWEWVVLIENGDEQYGVVAKDRALVVHPADFVRACFYDAERDFTAMLMFNMLIADRFKTWEPKGLSDLSEAVTRVVPRR